MHQTSVRVYKIGSRKRKPLFYVELAKSSDGRMTVFCNDLIGIGSKAWVGFVKQIWFMGLNDGYVLPISTP